MSDALNSRADAFLRSVQDADDPTREDFERVRAGVKARLAAGVAAGVATLLTAKAASGAAATTTTVAATGAAIGVATVSATVPPAAIASTGIGAALLTKIVAVVMITGAVAGGVTAVARRERAANVSSPSIPVAAIPATPKPPQPLPPRPPTLTQPLELAPSPSQTPSPSLAQAPTAAPPPALSAATAAATTTLPASPAGPSSLDAEISLLRDARSALQGGNPSRALQLLDTHDRLYPAGALSEDCAAERVYAYCAMGDPTQARALAERFLAAHPASPHATSVRNSCGSF